MRIPRLLTPHSARSSTACRPGSSRGPNDAQFQSTADDGRLIGPFNPALLKPAIAAPFLDLQFAEQVHTSLSARVREIVILAVGAVWQADYELYAHLAIARKAGLSEDAARAVATGRLPD